MSLFKVTANRLARWGLTNEPEAAAALDLAERLEDEELRPAAAAMLHAQFRTLLVDLRKLAPDEAAADEIDDLKAQIHLLPRDRDTG